MKQYRITSDKRVQSDIREAVHYYNSKVPGLGKRFYLEVKTAYKPIRTTLFFQVRYKEIHCLPLKKFPYMVHYSINETEKVVCIRAIINCYQNPETKWVVNEP